MSEVTPCAHMNFGAEVDVGRLTEVENGEVTNFMAEVKVWCAVCGKRFQFLGLRAGIDLQGARVSLDGLEAYLAICPTGAKPNPFQRIAYNIEGFDG